MKIIGLTGGVGSGKTQILEYLNNKYGGDHLPDRHAGKEASEKGRSVL